MEFRLTQIKNINKESHSSINIKYVFSSITLGKIKHVANQLKNKSLCSFNIEI